MPTTRKRGRAVPTLRLVPGGAPPRRRGPTRQPTDEETGRTGTRPSFSQSRRDSAQTPTASPPEGEITLEEMSPDEEPRDCVIRYHIGPDAVLLVSFDDRGMPFEEFKTRPELETPALIDYVMDRCRTYAPRRLRSL